MQNTTLRFRTIKFISLSVFFSLSFSGCAASKGVVDKLKQLDKKDEAIEKTLALEKPTLADLMTLLQARHTRLYYAAQAGNWALADHQVSAISNTLDRAGKLHDKWEDIPKPLSSLIPLITNGEIENLRKAIKAQSKQDFKTVFERLTKDCNTCHQATGRDYINIQIPTSPGYANMHFQEK
ncbi:MAG: hypothetical protein ACKV2V_22725 [Blastocatellia bacterium]